MKIFKKNQILLYIMVLILMVAGYLNYSNNTQNQVSLETSMKMDAKDDVQIADIGDATLVSSNDVTETSENNESSLNTINENNVNQNNADENNFENQNNIVESSISASNGSNSIETSSANDNEYFIKSKLDRDTMYSQMIETYENVLNSTNSLETQKQSATEEIKKINDDKNGIMICENLIKTKGFENSVIFVNGKSINVIIGAEELKQEEIAQIQNIVSREMNAEIENIHITNKIGAKK